MPKLYGYIRMIRQRQAEGIAAAKARGKTWGKPKRQLDKAFYRCTRRMESRRNHLRSSGRILRHDLIEF